jgi:hypothetical protein
MVRMHSPTVESTITKTYPDTQAWKSEAGTGGE